MIKPSLLLFLLLISNIKIFGETDYFSADSINRFAESLYAEGDYSGASLEFQRLIALYPIEPYFSGSVYKIGRCYQKSGLPQKASAFYITFLNKFPGSSLEENAKLNLAVCFAESSNYNSSLDIINKNYDTFPFLNDWSFLAGLDYFRLGVKEQGDKLFSLPTEILPVDRNLIFSEFQEFYKNHKRIQSKNPVLASIFSVIIPGSGKFYTDRPFDGLFSFVTVASFALFSAYYFSQENISSVRGWVTASLGFVFYTGDIYGSYIAADDYNNHMKKELDEKMDKVLNSYDK